MGQEVGDLKLPTPGCDPGRARCRCGLRRLSPELVGKGTGRSSATGTTLLGVALHQGGYGERGLQHSKMRSGVLCRCFNRAIVTDCIVVICRALQILCFRGGKR